MLSNTAHPPHPAGPIVNAATVAPAVSPPPGIAPMSGVSFVPTPAPPVDLDPPFDPAAGFKAAVANGIEANRPAAAAQPVGDPAPIPALVVGAAVPAQNTFRVVGGPARSHTVQLIYPVGDGETEISAIVVRRMSVAEVRDWTASLAADRREHLPMFELPDGRPVPHGALDALDHDDWVTLDAVATDFLPVALRGFLTTDPASETGDGSPA